MSKEMRKYIDAFGEFLAKRKKFEVIVSYDCSQIHNSFANQLRSILHDDYDIQEITLSNYKVGRLLTIDELDTLREKIVKAFSDSMITEGRREKRTVVSLIVPCETQFIIDQVINELAD